MPYVHITRQSTANKYAKIFGLESKNGEGGTFPANVFEWYIGITVMVLNRFFSFLGGGGKGFTKYFDRHIISASVFKKTNFHTYSQTASYIFTDRLIHIQTAPATRRTLLGSTGDEREVAAELSWSVGGYHR